MGFFKDLWRKEATEWSHGWVGPQGQQVEAETCYLRLVLRSLHIANVRVAATKLCGAVHCFSSFLHNQAGRAELHAFTSPSSLRGIDAKNLDRVIVADKTLLGPVPYRGDAIDVEIGLFTIKEDNLVNPVFSLLEGLTDAIGVAQVGAVTRVASQVASGIDKLTQEVTLEIGFAGELVPRAGNYAVVRLPRDQIDLGAAEVAADGRLTIGGKAVTAPYMVVGMVATERRRDWRTVTPLQEAYARLRDAALGARGDEVTALLAVLRRTLALSPDLLAGDADEIYKLVAAELAQPAVAADATRGPARAAPASLDELRLAGEARENRLVFDALLAGDPPAAPVRATEDDAAAPVGVTRAAVADARAELDRDPDAIVPYLQRAIGPNITAASARVALGSVDRLLATADRLASDSITPLVVRALSEEARIRTLSGVSPPVAAGDPYPDVDDAGPFQTMLATQDQVAVIDPEDWQFEEIADAHRWLWYTWRGWVRSHRGTIKAPFRPHTAAASGFVYDHPELTAQPLRMVLMSDFGAGLFPCKWIVHHLLENRPRPHLLFHLGDVYYGGTESDFARRFTPYMDRIGERTRVYALNANHEMYSDARHYFAFLDHERAMPNGLHDQEGSYFAVRLPGVQLVGLDTACNAQGGFEFGRVRDDLIKDWTAARLREGRARGLVNILLTSDEPYGLDGQNLALWGDLGPLATGGLVDLWFWGNTHHAALYKRAEGRKVVGCCVGHGGYPFYRTDRPAGDAGNLVEWVETRPRFPASTGLRQEMGLNGFAELTVRPGGTLDLLFVDWMNRPRAGFRMKRVEGALDYQRFL